MTAPRTPPLERLQVFLRYGSGFEERPNDKLIVGEELTGFLQLRPPDRFTALDRRPNPLLSGVSWMNYERPDYDGGRYANGGGLDARTRSMFHHCVAAAARRRGGLLGAPRSAIGRPNIMVPRSYPAGDRND